MNLTDRFRIGHLQEVLWNSEGLATSSEFIEEDGPLLIIEPRRLDDLGADVHWLNELAFDVLERYGVRLAFSIEEMESSRPYTAGSLDCDLSLLLIPITQLSDLSYPRPALVHELIHLRFTKPYVAFHYNASAYPKRLRQEASNVAFGKLRPASGMFENFSTHYGRESVNHEVEATFGEALFTVELLRNDAHVPFSPDARQESADAVGRLYQWLHNLPAALYHAEMFTGIQLHALSQFKSLERLVMTDGGDEIAFMYTPSGRRRNPEGGIIAEFAPHELRSWAFETYKAAPRELKNEIHLDVRRRGLRDMNSLEGAVCVWTNWRERFLYQVRNDFRALASLLPKEIDCAKRAEALYETITRTDIEYDANAQAAIASEWIYLQELLRPALVTWTPQHADLFTVLKQKSSR